MPQRSDRETVQAAATVPLPADAAFRLFVDELACWWPRPYTWSGGTLETIAIDPRPDGHCFERGPHNFHCDWGRVLAFERPHRIVLAWQIGPRREPEPNPARASEVEVRFSEAGAGTRVMLMHRYFERHGGGWEAYREGMGSAQGWSWILERYAEEAERRGAGP